MVKSFDHMVTLFRKNYVDPDDPSLGMEATDYFTDPEVGFFPRLGAKYFCLDYGIEGGLVELPNTPQEWRVTQRNRVDYCAIGIDKPERSLKPINLEHAHIHLQFQCEIETGAVLKFLQREMGHKKFKLITCRGASIEVRDYVRATGKHGGIDNPERKNTDGLPNPGGETGVMTPHEARENQRGKHHDSVAEIHQYISDHALDNNLDMFVLFFFFEKILTYTNSYSLVRTFPQVLPHRQVRLLKYGLLRIIFYFIKIYH